jgi:hypothetical protein
MARKNHAPGAGGGKEKGRSAGDQQTGGVTGGKLGGTNPLRYHDDVGGRRDEGGQAGGGTPPETERVQDDKDRSGRP